MSDLRRRFSNPFFQECVNFKNSAFLRKKYEKICSLIDKIYSSDQDSLICEGYIEEAGRAWWFWINFTKQHCENIFLFLVKEKAINYKFTKKEFIEKIHKGRSILEISSQIAECRSVVKLIINISVDPGSPNCTHFFFTRLSVEYGFKEKDINKAFKFFGFSFVDV